VKNETIDLIDSPVAKCKDRTQEYDASMLIGEKRKRLKQTTISAQFTDSQKDTVEKKTHQFATDLSTDMTSVKMHHREE
jgi:hypothetical protein